MYVFDVHFHSCISNSSVAHTKQNQLSKQTFFYLFIPVYMALKVIRRWSELVGSCVYVSNDRILKFISNFPLVGEHEASV